MLKLLIVDDEQIEREGLQVILQKAFPEVSIAQAKNGRVAVEMVDEFMPDLSLDGYPDAGDEWSRSDRANHR